MAKKYKINATSHFIGNYVVYLSIAVMSQEAYVSDGAVFCVIYPPFHTSYFYQK
jgi:hypothetical protein